MIDILTIRLKGLCNVTCENASCNPMKCLIKQFVNHKNVVE